MCSALPCTVAGRVSAGATAHLSICTSVYLHAARGKRLGKQSLCCNQFLLLALYVLRSTRWLLHRRAQPRARAAAVPMQPPEPGPAAAPGGTALLPPLPQRCRLGRNARSRPPFWHVCFYFLSRSTPRRTPSPPHRFASERPPESSRPPGGAVSVPSRSLPPASPAQHYACALPHPHPSASGPGGGGGMERELLRQVLSYHGPSLLALLRSEQHDNPDFRGLLPPPGTVFEPPRGALRSPSAWWGITGGWGRRESLEGRGAFSARSPPSGPRKMRSSTPRYSASSPKRRTYSLLSRGNPMVLLPTTLEKMKVRASSWLHTAPPKPYVCERFPNACWTPTAPGCARCPGSLFHAHPPPLRNLSLIPSPPTLPTHSSLPFPRVLFLSSESRAQHCSSTPFQELWAALRPFCCSGPKKPRHLSDSLYVLFSRPFLLFVVLPWILSNRFMPFLYCGAPACPQCSRYI